MARIFGRRISNPFRSLREKAPEIASAFKHLPSTIKAWRHEEEKNISSRETVVISVPESAISPDPDTKYTVGEFLDYIEEQYGVTLTEDQKENILGKHALTNQKTFDEFRQIPMSKKALRKDANIDSFLHIGTALYNASRTSENPKTKGLIPDLHAMSSRMNNLVGEFIKDAQEKEAALSSITVHEFFEFLKKEKGVSLTEENEKRILADFNMQTKEPDAQDKTYIDMLDAPAKSLEKNFALQLLLSNRDVILPEDALTTGVAGLIAEATRKAEASRSSSDGTEYSFLSHEASTFTRSTSLAYSLSTSYSTSASTSSGGQSFSGEHSTEEEEVDESLVKTAALPTVFEVLRQVFHLDEDIVGSHEETDRLLDVYNALSNLQKLLPGKRLDKNSTVGEGGDVTMEQITESVLKTQLDTPVHTTETPKPLSFAQKLEEERRPKLKEAELGKLVEGFFCQYYDSEAKIAKFYEISQFSKNQLVSSEEGPGKVHFTKVYVACFDVLHPEARGKCSSGVWSKDDLYEIHLPDSKKFNTAWDRETSPAIHIS